MRGSLSPAVMTDRGKVYTYSPPTHMHTHMLTRGEVQSVRRVIVLTAEDLLEEIQQTHHKALKQLSCRAQGQQRIVSGDVMSTRDTRYIYRDIDQ